MKLKFYFYFQLTEHFFRKLRNHLAETNSWSSPQGTKQWDSSGLQSSLKLCVKGPAVTETAALTEVTSWHRPWSSAPHTGTCQERLHWNFLMGKELKQCWGRDKHLEDGASCSSRTRAAVSTRGPEPNRSAIPQITNHWTVISEIQDKQQWLSKKAFRLNWHLPTGTAVPHGQQHPLDRLKYPRACTALSLSLHDSTPRGEQWGQLHTATAHTGPSRTLAEKAGGSSTAHSHYHIAQICFTTSDGQEGATGIFQPQLWLKVHN